MRHRHFGVALGLSLALILPPAGADFDSAAAAIDRGEYQAAFAELEPLARAGDARAQDALAAMYLRGLGVSRDVRAGMGWFCLLAHQAEGGRGIMQAAWYLAEWFRTGGGVPGARYNDGSRAAEDPVRAYFWFSVMAEQAQLYENVHEDSVRLGKIGRTAVGSVLFEKEREEIAAAVARWRPRPANLTPQSCLAIPKLATGD